MKIGVTGAQGFIASHVVEELHEQGHYVIGFQRHLKNAVGNNRKHDPDEIYVGDLRDKEAVERFVSKCDKVINLAGILGTQETVNNPYPSIEVNILGGLNVLEACKLWKVPLVQIAVGNHWMNNSYSITRTTCERFALMYAKEHGVKVNVVRALNAFGERQTVAPVKKIMPTFITKALKGEDITIYGDGTSLMDMIYVKDLAKILIEILLRSNTYGNIFEAGTGHGFEVKEIAQKVIDATNSKSKIVYTEMRPGEDKHSKVVATNPYPFEYTDFSKALEKTIKYYKDL